MGNKTSISWTDHTFNPWWGCTKVSPGCDHCYAESFDKRVGGTHWGKGEPRRTFGDKHWNEPLKWDKQAAKDGVMRKVFCASMADVMDDECPAGSRERLWNLIDNTPNLVWQLLTKRPQRYYRYLPPNFVHKNVWLGTTTENQEFYDIRWPYLRKIAKDMELISFVSYEPALGPLTMGRWGDVPNWVICGGESGHSARPMMSMWAGDLKEECDRRGAVFFFKQRGEFVDAGDEEFGKLPSGRLKYLRSDGSEWTDEELKSATEYSDVCTMKWVGRERAGKTLYGKTYHEFPKC